MTEKLHALAKDKEKLANWLNTFHEFRSYKEKASADVVLRRRQLISQLCQIFPLNDANTSLPTIGECSGHNSGQFFFKTQPV